MLMLSIALPAQYVALIMAAMAQLISADGDLKYHLQYGRVVSDRSDAQRLWAHTDEVGLGCCWFDVGFRKADY